MYDVHYLVHGQLGYTPSMKKYTRRRSATTGTCGQSITGDF
jgi:hypothetical protein